jgi:uncharacterized protein
MRLSHPLWNCPAFASARVAQSGKMDILVCIHSNCIYNKSVAITFDPAKNERNIRERGLSFERAADFDFASALIADYSRNGEMRRIAVGYLDKRLHLLCYLPQPDGIRVISFQKTNKREAKLYGKPQTID